MKKPRKATWMLLGAIADDFTGATDLALTPARGGMPVVQTIGVSDIGEVPPAADAVVVALRSRTLPAQQTVEQPLMRCDWLRSAGAQRIIFKYYSTFDSTDKGYISLLSTDQVAEFNRIFPS